MIKLEPFRFFMKHERIEALVFFALLLFHLYVNLRGSERIIFHIIGTVSVTALSIYVIALMSNLFVNVDSLAKSFGLVVIGVMSVVPIIMSFSIVLDVRNDRRNLFYSKDKERLLLGGYVALLAGLFILIQTLKMLQYKDGRKIYFVRGCVLTVAAGAGMFFLSSEDVTATLRIMVLIALVVGLMLLIRPEKTGVPVKDDGGLVRYAMAFFTALFVAFGFGMGSNFDKAKAFEKFASVVTFFDKFAGLGKLVAKVAG